MAIDESEEGDLPSTTSIGAGNGGEYRKVRERQRTCPCGYSTSCTPSQLLTLYGGRVLQSFHGYAPGYGQVLESPQELQLTPMQIDTWNRAEMDLLKGEPFVPGPLPRSSLAPPGAGYSGRKSANDHFLPVPKAL